MVNESTGADQENLEISTLNYETAAEKLEAILASLETGTLSLEESLVLYERGAALANHCELKLEEAELRVRQWQPTGEPEPFAEWQEEQE